MILGTAISQLADKPELRMKFDFEENEENEMSEVQEFHDLLNLNDAPGTLRDFCNLTRKDASVTLAKKPNPQKQKKKSTVNEEKKVTKPKFQVIDSDSSSSSDDQHGLTPYAKPDSDPSDSDSDSDADTAVVSKKDTPKAPVYIRDLATQLKSDSADTLLQALRTAPPLIRRKANFGSELLDSAALLANTLISLDDAFDLPGFNALRMRCMISLLVARPREMGPYFAHAFFSGDYSLGQRLGVVSAMGLGARELAGYRTDNETEDMAAATAFPSQTLPERLHRLYLGQGQSQSDKEEETRREMNVPTSKLSQSLLSRPHDSSAPPQAPPRRKKIIKNDLTHLVATAFFYPLTGPFASLNGGGSGGKGSLYHAPHMLPIYVKTLAIILMSAGPSTLGLPQMSSEFWGLLFSLRSRVARDRATMEAVLFGLLTTLRVNEDKRRLATECAREVVETREWVSEMFEKIEGIGGVGGNEEDERIKSLAAGVLVATNEVVEKYQRLMVGDLV